MCRSFEASGIVTSCGEMSDCSQIADCKTIANKLTGLMFLVNVRLNEYSVQTFIAPCLYSAMWATLKVYPQMKCGFTSKYFKSVFVYGAGCHLNSKVNLGYYSGHLQSCHQKITSYFYNFRNESMAVFYCC